MSFWSKVGKSIGNALEVASVLKEIVEIKTDIKKNDVYSKYDKYQDKSNESLAKTYRSTNNSSEKRAIEMIMRERNGQ